MTAVSRVDLRLHTATVNGDRNSDTHADSAPSQPEAKEETETLHTHKKAFTRFDAFKRKVCSHVRRDRPKGPSKGGC